MPANQVPEDSVLRRHYESAQEFKRQEMLDNPTDSVLKRHHQQMQGSGGNAAGQAGPAPSGQSKGFFAWLKSLFS